jgi:hypothetical protein
VSWFSDWWDDLWDGDDDERDPDDATDIRNYTPDGEYPPDNWVAGDGEEMFTEDDY